MSAQDQAHWDERYSQSQVGTVNSFLEVVVDRLPRAGRCLDVAGGSGANAVALAGLGLDTTLVDVSGVALGMAEREASDRSVDLRTERLDLEHSPLPAGPFDLVVCTNYLDRGLIGDMAERLGPTGLLVVVVATVTNLERNERPSRRHLVERGELARLTNDLEPVVYQEGWFGGRHEARVLARRCLWSAEPGDSSGDDRR